MSKRSNKKNRKNKKMANNAINRQEIGSIGARTRGELMRGRSLRADHKRNIAEMFGYPSTITLKQHWDMANRHGIAYNLCYGIVSDCWRVSPVIYDGKEDAGRRKNSPTKFERACDELFDRLNVWQFMEDLDFAQRPMRYGSLMAVTSEQDATRTTDELINLPTIDYLVGLRVYHEAQLPVETAHQNFASMDYGKPIMYNVHTNVAGSTNEWEDSGCQVHASRVFSVGEGAMGDSIYGIPALEASFEALMDNKKVTGAGAEGIFQNASNKYINRLPTEATAADAAEVLESQEDFDNGIGVSTVTFGDISLLQTNVSDPTPAWMASANEACSPHNKPMKMVVGNQTGERAASDDIASWNRVIMDRQGRYCTQQIKGFLKFLDKFNFPKPTNELNIVFRDLNESTAEQQVDLAKKRAETNKLCIESRMQPVYSVKYIQTEAGSPVVDVIVLDDGGEGEE